MRTLPAAAAARSRLLPILLFSLGILAAGYARATPETDGEATWNSKCDTCHGASPSGARANAASSPGVILEAQTNVAGMQGLSVSSTERSNLAAYIESVINTSPMNISTGYNVTKVQSLTGKVYLNTNATHLTTLLLGANTPSKGTVSFDNANNSFTYNPGTCQYGLDTFTFRARNAGDTVTTSSRLVNITIGNPPIPDITSATLKTGTVGVPLTYNIVAANCPESYSALSLPAGLAISASTGSITGTPDAALTTFHTLRAHNVSGIGTQSTQFQIGPGPQAINFPAQTTASRPFSLSTFSISPLANLTPQSPATVTSGLPITYTSGSPSICTVSGTTVTMVSASAVNPCIIEANQAGNSNWNAAPEKTVTVTITGTVPGAPTAPGAVAGDTTASISFTPPANNGGSTITTYTATCSASGQVTRTGTNGASPVVVNNLVNGVTYACNVKATNATGQGAASTNVNVTPQNTPVPPAFTSANNTTFTRGTFGTFTVTRTGTPTPTLSLFSGSLPSGVGFDPATGILSGTAALGSNASYTLTFRAQNASGTVDQTFTLNVAKIPQTITFAQPASPQMFTPTPFAAPATSSSGLTVSVASTTPGLCSYASPNVTLLNAGDCKLNATQAGNGDYSAATPILRTIVVTPATQTITFKEQVTPRNFVPSGTFAISPTGSASSGLAVTHGTLTPAVCTVAGTTVTMVAPGLCTISANQPGNANYQAADEVTQGVQVNATVPDAPAIGGATPGSQQADIAFTPPANNGGSAITSYTATCNPGNKTGTNAVSPVTVMNLANGTPYTCSVVATNAVGNSPSSGTVAVTPQGATGAALWQSVCSACHGTEPPSGPRFNAAGTTATVLQYVRANQPQMLASTAVQDLTTQDLENLAAYIRDQLPPVLATTLPNTPKSVSLAGTMFLNTVSFQQVEIVSQPASGTLSNFVGLSSTYTPAPGTEGTFTFTYRGRRNTPSLLLGDVRTGTIRVDAAAAVLTANVVGNGDVSGPGIACPSDCSEPQNPGATVMLSANPGSGALFGGWTGCDSVNEAQQCTVTMAGSRSVTATFITPSRGIDFNADGKKDLLWINDDGRQAIWLMDGLAPTATQEIIGAATGWSVKHVADLNGDGKGDLVWQHTDGRAALYLMDGTIPTSTNQILNAGPWTITHTPDLNGDGKADLIFQNADGTIAAWLMNGTAMTAGTSLLGAGSGWAVTRTGDFDGDGKADLVWTHADGRVAIWLMDGLAVKSTQQILNAGTGWSVTHTADFNGDGKADLVWQNTDGSIALWLMDGTMMTSGIGLLGAGTGWSVTRVGDFDGNGKADLFFLHQDGRAAIYLMDGLTPTATVQILNAGGGWSAKRVQDLNGDGKADIVWQNVDGSVAIWLMNGTAMTSGTGILGPGTGWSVSGVSQ